MFAVKGRVERCCLRYVNSFANDPRCKAFAEESGEEEEALHTDVVGACAQGDARQLQQSLASASPNHCRSVLGSWVFFCKDEWRDEWLSNPTKVRDAKEAEVPLRRAPLVFLPLCDGHLRVRDLPSLKRQMCYSGLDCKSSEGMADHGTKQAAARDCLNRLECVRVLMQWGAPCGFVSPEQLDAPELISLVHCLALFIRNFELEGNVLDFSLDALRAAVMHGCPLNRQHLSFAPTALFVVLWPAHRDQTADPHSKVIPTLLQTLVRLGADPDSIEDPDFVPLKSSPSAPEPPSPFWPVLEKECRSASEGEGEEEPDAHSHDSSVDEGKAGDAPTGQQEEEQAEDDGEEALRLHLNDALFYQVPSFSGPPLVWPRQRLCAGMRLDVMDTVGQILLARVLFVAVVNHRMRPFDSWQNSHCYVMYEGWPTQWNEWIPLTSSRLAPAWAFSQQGPGARSVMERISFPSTSFQSNHAEFNTVMYQPNLHSQQMFRWGEVLLEDDSHNIYSRLFSQLKHAQVSAHKYTSAVAVLLADEITIPPLCDLVCDYLAV